MNEYYGEIWLKTRFKDDEYKFHRPIILREDLASIALNGMRASGKLNCEDICGVRGSYQIRNFKKL